MTHLPEPAAADALSLRLLAEEAELYQLLLAEDYAQAETDLLHFTQSAWHLLEPSHVYVDGWHLHAVAEHLEAAVLHHQLQRIVVNIPYRTMKSTLLSVALQPWAWVRQPSLRFLTGSHKADLATRDALRSRRLIESPWYQAAWADRYQLATDQNQKTRFENDHTGNRIVFGMSTGVTGEGADVITIDDPHAAKTAMYSAAERETVIRTYAQEVATRLNDPKTGVIVLIMQRLHEDDLSGHVLKEEGWEHLCLPAEFDPRRVCYTRVKPRKPEGLLGRCVDGKFRWDPRDEPNELLWPARHTREWLDKEKARLGSFGAAGQLAQLPAPDGGGLIKLEWFKRYDTLPERGQWTAVYQFWDTAQKPDEVLNAPWVCGTWLLCGDKAYLVRVLREWMDYPSGKRAVKSEFDWAVDRFGMKPNGVIIEDKSTGASLLQELEGLSTVGMEPNADKLTRMAVETPAIEAGQVYLPTSAPWLNDYEHELKLFPNSSTKDQVDMTSMALRYLREQARGPMIW